jgi:hypothetical protein
MEKWHNSMVHKFTTPSSRLIFEDIILYYLPGARLSFNGWAWFPYLVVLYVLVDVDTCTE